MTSSSFLAFPVTKMNFFLTKDAAKVAGTERGVTEPQATFSACFGAVFLVWHPTKYATMLGELLRTHGAQVWLRQWCLCWTRRTQSLLVLRCHDGSGWVLGRTARHMVDWDT